VLPAKVGASLDLLYPGLNIKVIVQLLQPCQSGDDLSGGISRLYLLLQNVDQRLEARQR
jgi:hypothetical protein